MQDVKDDSWGIHGQGFRSVNGYISRQRNSSSYLRQLRQTSAISSASPGLQSSSQRLGVMPLVLFWNFFGSSSLKSRNLSGENNFRGFDCLFVTENGQQRSHGLSQHRHKRRLSHRFILCLLPNFSTAVVSFKHSVQLMSNKENDS